MQEELTTQTMKVDDLHMHTGKELGAAIEAARKLKRVTKVTMADHFGVKPPSIQDWVQRGTIDKDRLIRVWMYFRDVAGPAHWGLDAFPFDDPRDRGGSHQERAEFTVPPLMTSRDELPNMPDLFRYALPDDSMAPDYPRGVQLILSKSRAVRPGLPVLVKTASGELHARRYTQGRGAGQWTATPANAAYMTLDSQEDGLEVVGVYRGVFDPSD
jgi:Peptidase S24-like